MERTLPSDDHAPPGIKSWQLWFSLAAGVGVWAIHFIIVYALTSLTCAWGWFPFTVAGFTGLQFIQFVVTVIAAAITITAGYLAFHNQQRLRQAATIDTNRHYFMARLGLALDLLFTALIVISLIPVLSLPACG